MTKNSGKKGVDTSDEDDLLQSPSKSGSTNATKTDLEKAAQLFVAASKSNNSKKTTGAPKLHSAKLLPNKTTVSAGSTSTTATATTSSIAGIASEANFVKFLAGSAGSSSTPVKEIS